MATFDHTCGFESGSESEQATVAFSGAIITGNLFGYGNYYGRVSCLATETQYFEFGTTQNGSDAVINSSTRYWRAAIQFDLLPVTDDEPILIIKNSSGGNKYELRIHSSGVLKLYDNTLALVATGTAVLVVDQPYVLEGSCAGNGSVTVVIKVDGNVDISATCDTSANNIGRFRFGRDADRNGNSIQYRYDHIALCVDDFPGIGYSLRVPVVADGNYLDWTVGAGSSNRWENVDEIPSSGTDYLVSTGVAGDAYTARLQTCALAGIPQGATINAIQVLGMVLRNGASNGAVKARIRSNGTDGDPANGQATAGSENIVRWCSRVDPSDSQPWTQTKIDQGVEIGVVENDTDLSRLNAIMASVDFALTHKRVVLARF